MTSPTDPTADRHDIAETVYRYAYGIDTRDFELYRSIFADEVDIDFSSYSRTPGSKMSGEAWVAGVRPLFEGLAATQHTMSNPQITIAGNRATCRMYMQAHHVLDPHDAASWFTIGGYYDDGLVRDARGPAGWLLTSVRLTVLWRRGDPEIMAMARRR